MLGKSLAYLLFMLSACGIQTLPKCQDCGSDCSYTLLEDRLSEFYGAGYRGDPKPDYPMNSDMYARIDMDAVFAQGVEDRSNASAPRYTTCSGDADCSANPCRRAAGKCGQGLCVF